MGYYTGTCIPLSQTWQPRHWLYTRIDDLSKIRKRTWLRACASMDVCTNGIQAPSRDYASLSHGITQSAPWCHERLDDNVCKTRWLKVNRAKLDPAELWRVNSIVLSRQCQVYLSGFYQRHQKTLDLWTAKVTNCTNGSSQLRCWFAQATSNSTPPHAIQRYSGAILNY